MCGIAGIILKQATIDLREKIVAMSRAISHRGPDGEGFLFAGRQSAFPVSSTPEKFTRKDLLYIPKQDLSSVTTENVLAFTHRRLSVIDLSDAGHQPMCTHDGRLWIVYNGELYNYIELREELKKLGHSFVSESDTEVILAAYLQWGAGCVKHFDGMWAFCIYDMEKQQFFASRDRLGVKPFYYVDNAQLFAFASEQKAFVRSGLVPFRIDQKALHDYLVNDLLEQDVSNFFEGISELFPGHNLIYDIGAATVQTSCYYRLSEKISENNQLGEEELIHRIRDSFDTAVRLRMRSDVEVGTCLSGGIDSSALAVTMSRFSGQPLHCFTSVFRGEALNEEVFADLVAKKIGAIHHKTEPSLDGFEKEIDTLIYSQDIPIWSTSTYAQYKVMELAKQNKIKVVLDGQGADELFAGYHHHFVAQWNNSLSGGRYMTLFKELFAANKTIPNAFSFYAKESLKQNYFVHKKQLSLFLKDNFIASQEVKNPVKYFNSVNEQLLDDIYRSRLKAFLKCEDRCGMWHSIESRTPFSDDLELIELLFSFDGNKKIKRGVSKYLLREALKDKLPREIYSRYDKKGFETPMQQWVSALRPKLLAEIRKAELDVVNYDAIEKWDTNNAFHYKLLFKLFVLSRWKAVFSGELKMQS